MLFTIAIAVGVGPIDNRTPCALVFYITNLSNAPNVHPVQIGTSALTKQIKQCVEEWTQTTFSLASAGRTREIRLQSLNPIRGAFFQFQRLCPSRERVSATREATHL